MVGVRFAEIQYPPDVGHRLPRIAERNLEQTAGGVIHASLGSSYPEGAELSEYETAFAACAARSVESYRGLVRDPGFVEYYAASTPLEEIGALPLGSRPARRSGQATIDDLRAIIEIRLEAVVV